MRLLLVAPTCDPDDVGESWVAYQWVKSLSEQHQVTLLTHLIPDRGPLTDKPENLRIIQWPEMLLPKRIDRINNMLKPSYIPFYYRARRWIRRALKDGEQFDVAHQLSPVALRYPSPFTGLGIPYILGPTGGSIEAPPGMGEEDTSPWYVSLRRFDQMRLRHDPKLRRSYREAGCVVGISDYVRELLGDIELQRFVAMSDTGIETLPPAIDRSGRDGTVRLLFVGRMVRSKGARDAIRAMTELRDLDVHLDMLGEGHDSDACAELITELDLAARVTMHGRVSRDRVDDFYHDADVFLFPSFREPGGLVVAEAMSHGLPAVVCARGGPASAIDDQCGFRISAVDENQYAHDLAQAVRILVLDPALRRKMGAHARERIHDIGLWKHKVERMNALYHEIAGLPLG